MFPTFLNGVDVGIQLVNAAIAPSSIAADSASAASPIAIDRRSCARVPRWSSSTQLIRRLFSSESLSYVDEPQSCTALPLLPLLLLPLCVCSGLAVPAQGRFGVVSAGLSPGPKPAFFLLFMVVMVARVWL
jgi:hypothetical protein